MTWHSLMPADDTVFDTAPIRHRYSVELDVPPERVWAALTSDDSLSEWGLGVRVRWTAPRPFAVGTTREVVLPGRAMTLRESFFVWDEGRRHAFYVYEASRGLFVRFAENYEIEPMPSGRARFVFTCALEPQPKLLGLFRRIDPLVGKSFGVTAKAAKRYFKKHP